MSDLTPDPLWDGRGSDPELERLERLLSPLRSTAELPPLPARRPPGPPAWVWLIAAGVLLAIGSASLVLSSGDDPDPELTGVAESARGPGPASPDDGSDRRRDGSSRSGRAASADGQASGGRNGAGGQWVPGVDLGDLGDLGEAGDRPRGSEVGSDGERGAFEHRSDPQTVALGGRDTFIFYEDEMSLSANPVHERSMSDVRLNELIHVSLFAPDYADQPHPALAREATLDESGRVLTVSLADVDWSDGVPVTASDVVFTLESYKNPASRSLDRHRWDFITRAEAKDDKTVVLSLARAFREPPISQLYLKVLPEHSFKGTGIPYNHTYRTKPVTAGPFRVKEKDHKNWILEQSRSLRSPKLAQIRAQEVPEKRTQAELLSYEYGHAMIEVEPRQRAELEADQCCTLKPYPSKSWWYTAFNEGNLHLADERVRSALNLVVDREQALALIGEGELLSGPFTPSSRYYNHDVILPTADLAQATGLLEEAGYRKAGREWTRDGSTIDLRYFYDDGLGDQGQTVATNIVGQLRKFGINVSNPAAVGGESWEERIMQKKDYDLVMGVWSFDVAEDIGQLFATGGARNFIGYEDDRTDQLLSGAYETDDPSEQQAYMRELHRRLSETSPYVFMWSLRNFSAISWDVVGAHVQAFYYFSQFSDWDIKHD